MIRSLVLVCALATAAHADTTHSPAVAAATREVATAKAHLKAAKATERAQRKQASAAKKVAKLRAALKKAEDLALGCGTCQDNHDGSCTCPPVGGK